MRLYDWSIALHNSIQYSQLEIVSISGHKYTFGLLHATDPFIVVTGTGFTCLFFFLIDTYLKLTTSAVIISTNHKIARISFYLSFILEREVMRHYILQIYLGVKKREAEIKLLDINF
jgi:hypothetical protein